ncbi:MAG: hypothetical protein Q8P02_04990, partial [Candidatus Micrarchaeota archaeon]|nr:hypothetical protein [Candidatus Micrarchaeota archaeon]
MKTVQINLKISQKLYDEAKNYAERYGFRTIQELASESMREKIFEEDDYDHSYTKKEIALIDKLIRKSLAEG